MYTLWTSVSVFIYSISVYVRKYQHFIRLYLHVSFPCPVRRCHQGLHESKTNLFFQQRPDLRTVWINLRTRSKMYLEKRRNPNRERTPPPWFYWVFLCNDRVSDTILFRAPHVFPMSDFLPDLICSVQLDAFVKNRLSGILRGAEQRADSSEMHCSTPGGITSIV